MITLLKGEIEFGGEKFLIINVHGVGYKVFVGPETLQKITEKLKEVNPSTKFTQSKVDGLRVKIWTHQYIREDAMDLYGFLNFSELDLFETLIHISGIGPKGALGVLSIAPVDTLKKAIAAGDTSYLTRVSGIGRKTAEKIVLELKDKMAGRGVTVEAPELKDEADALEALVSLGYSQREARDALARVSQDISSVEKRVGEALKKLGKR